MKLSVIIPCYNEVQTIESLIEAVRGAPVDDIEIVVVDDGSSDGTRKLLQGMAEAKHSQILKSYFIKPIKARGLHCAQASNLPRVISALCRMPTWNTIHRNFRS